MRNIVFLDGINKKSEKAWEELYRYYYAPLCNYSEKVVGEGNVGEDIVQECLIRMWHADVEFTELRALTAWLYKSVYNASISFLREKRTQERLQDDLLREGWLGEEDACALALREETISRFYEILAELPAQQREIILYCLKGLKVQEIADMLGVSENTIKTQKKRAYLFIREHLGNAGMRILFFLLARR